MSGVLGTLEVFERRMLDSVAANWAQIPDLAGVLVLERDFPWRVAHQVVAIMVRLAEERGLTPADVRSELLDSAAVEYTGKPAGLPLETIRSALDPAACVRNRVVTGSPGPAEVKKQLGASWKLLNKDRRSVNARREKLAGGEKKLAEAVRRIIL
jgi:argininosuccinate lyase